jgi:hypothetical protein
MQSWSISHLQNILLEVRKELKETQPDENSPRITNVDFQASNFSNAAKLQQQSAILDGVPQYILAIM